MSFHLSSRIGRDGFLYCELSSNGENAIEDPVICFSVQVPAKILSGGIKIEGLGGFTALRLEGMLSADFPLSFVIGFEEEEFLASNRAWLPQGPYLRLGDQTEVVKVDYLIGVRPSPEPEVVVPHSGLPLVPFPHSWEPGHGQNVQSQFMVSGDFSDAVAAIDDLADRRGLQKISGDGAALLMTKSTAMSEEAYELDITETSIQLSAGGYAGALYGLISILTLKETLGVLPVGLITDRPRFEWRGFMLDCGREFYDVASICKLLDLMALMKLNRFHWHFMDDEALRLETDVGADIWQKSGFRGEGHVVPAVFGGRAGPTGGTYSKSDVAMVLSHAGKLGIEILPEIEVPAHSMALTRIRPELRDPHDTGTEASVGGYHRNVVNPALAETWELLEPFAVEVAELFPFRHIHLGGDELPDDTWSGSPLIDGYKTEHGLSTHQDVQGHLMERLARKLSDRGVTVCAWQEAADGCSGGIGNDAILFSWTGAGPGREAAKRGHRIVMCPAQHTYFDMAQTKDPDDWGANWAATYALDQSFLWDPVPSGTAEDMVLGVEGTFWSEFTSEAKQYEAMIAPRILALATKGWSAEDAISLDELRRTVTCYTAMLSRFGWASNHASIWANTPPGSIRRVDD